MDNDNEQFVSVKKQKHIEILMARTIVVSVQSSIEDILVSYLFLSKKDLGKKLYVFAIRKSSQYCVYRSNKKLCILRCVDSSYLWKLRATNV